MVRPRHLLLAMTAAMTLLGSAHAAGEPVGNPDTMPTATEPVAEPFGVTLTCSARLPTAVAGCFLERRIATWGAFEIAVGVDMQASFSDAAQGHLAPYAVLSWFGETASAWVEVRLPELNGVPALGDSDYVRLGFSTRF